MLTTIKLKPKTKHFTTSPHIQFDLEKLEDPKIAEVFQAEVGGKFAALCVLDSNVDPLAKSLKERLLSTSEEVPGRQRKKIQPWVTNKVLDLCDQRWQLKQQKYTSTLEYRKVFCVELLPFLWELHGTCTSAIHGADFFFFLVFPATPKAQH